MEDNKIISLFMHRSEKAIKCLAEKYEKLIYSVIRQIVTDREDVEECINDTYLGVWNSIPPNSPEYLSAYICKIAKNVALKRYRKENAQKRKGQIHCTLEEIGQVFVGSNTENILEAEELGHHINDFLKSLSKKDRTLFVNRYWFSYSNKQLAKMYQIKENTVSVRLLRMREKLKKYLQERGYVYE